jgi:3-deoxy-manno-octulosonate cytidylyltransferase (CMP-KDO synthetase)
LAVARVIAVIPARLGSTRFPAKVLASATGQPLIQHVVENARRARSLERVVVATDDARVEAAVHAFGGECVMTRPDHPNGTSRLHEASQKLGLAPDDIVVNVQGDEPEMEPEVIDAAVSTMRDPALRPVPVVTVATPFQAGEDPANPNIVKVVLGLDGRALYFSRSLIPHVRTGAEAPASPLRHVGLYVYRAGFLATYSALLPAPLERSEMLEQLRVLENGHEIRCTVRECRGVGIDTPEQYEAFVQRWKKGRA